MIEASLRSDTCLTGSQWYPTVNFDLSKSLTPGIAWVLNRMSEVEWKFFLISSSSDSSANLQWDGFSGHWHCGSMRGLLPVTNAWFYVNNCRYFGFVNFNFCSESSSETFTLIRRQKKVPLPALESTQLCEISCFFFLGKFYHLESLDRHKLHSGGYRMLTN